MIDEESKSASKSVPASAPLGFAINGRWLLALILIVAAALRLYRLDSLPPAIFRDEAEKALNGWFLLHGGVDASGRPWPVFIEVFGVTTSAIYQYAVIPFLAIGGLNEWTARLPAALAGLATVWVTWLFCRRVWNRETAAWAAGFLAVSPWHVPLSRWAQQGIFLPLLFIIAAWGVAVFLTPKSGSMNSATKPHEDPVRDSETGATFGLYGLLIAAVALAVAMYAYDPARLFAPLLSVCAAVLWWRIWAREWRHVVVALLVFLVFLTPVIWLLLIHSDEAQARFRFLSIFQPGISFVEAGIVFLKNYASHFSPGFLLTNGDDELRHSGGVGMLNIVEFIFAIAGAVVALRRRCRWGIFILLWILLSPVASSLTRVGIPHALRSQMALPAWQILAAVGIVSTAQQFAISKRKTVYQIILLLSLLGSLPFIISYFGSYAGRSAVNWQYGVKQSLQYLNNPNTDDSMVLFQYVTGAEYLVPFYLAMDRAEFMEMKSGNSRYHSFPSRQNPADQRQAFAARAARGPAAWVSPPGVPGPSGTVAIPIRLPGNEQTAPAMLIFINEQLMNQVKEQSHQ